MLDGLPAYPTAPCPGNASTCWADSAYMATGGTPGALSNAGYGIAHLAAIFPALDVGRWSAYSIA